MTYKAVYSSYMTQYAYDAKTLQDAIGYLSIGVEYGELSPICIVDPNGTVLVAENYPRVRTDEHTSSILKRLGIEVNGKLDAFNLIEY